MAKKKSNPRPKRAVNPFELAAVVSDRVKISDVKVVRCGVELAQGKDFDEVEISILTRVLVSHSVHPERDEIRVFPDFSLRGSESLEADPGPSDLLTISCRFLLTYEAPGVADLPEDSIEAFAQLNGVYNAWPYWREFVQNMVARMGLPRLVIPVFRFGDGE